MKKGDAMYDDEENIDPLDVLKEDLADDAIEVQLDAVRNIKTIILALGHSRTCTQLMPFLDNYCFPVEVQAAKSAETYSNVKALACKEEVLKELAVQLNGELVPHFGGSQEAGEKLLPMLEKLASVEETVIREAAVNSLISVAKVMKPKDVDLMLPPCVTRLAEGDWWTSRFSAAGLAPRMYFVFQKTNYKREMLSLLQALVKDEMPMVRQQAYRHAPDLITVIDYDLLEKCIKPIIKALSKELQESIRSILVDVVRELSKVASKHLPVSDLTVEFLRITVNDENWRIRKKFISQVIAIAEAAPPRIRDEHVLESFVQMLKDTEPTVRVKAIKMMPKFLPMCEPAAVGKFLTTDVVQLLVEDSYSEVREAISASFLYMGPALEELGEESTLETLKAFSKDDQGEVRLNFCSCLGKACERLGWQKFNKDLMPIVQDLHKDAKWRVRHDILKNVTPIGVVINNTGEAMAPLLQLLFESFHDVVNDVRDEAIAQVIGLTKHYGMEWCDKTVMPKLIEIYTDKNKFLHRMIPIKAIRALAQNSLLDKKMITGSESLAVVLKACRDKTSNVRLLAAQTMHEIILKMGPAAATGPSEECKKIKQLLEPMVKDRDEDVKYFALNAFTKAKEFGYGGL